MTFYCHNQVSKEYQQEENKLVNKDFSQQKKILTKYDNLKIEM